MPSQMTFINPFEALLFAWADAPGGEVASAFWQAVFGSIGQLMVVGIAAYCGNFLYQRARLRLDARSDLIKDVDAFAARLYKPRKLYQMYLRKNVDGDLLADVLPESARETRRNEALDRCLEELIDIAGQFRAIQIKIIPLFGENRTILAHYVAIWIYLKEIRERMVRHETLYFHHEDATSIDAFYRLIDAFRYHLLTSEFIRNKTSADPKLVPVRPPLERVSERYAESQPIYEKYFHSQPRHTSIVKNSD